jgi:MSHA biogenesis protein MshK
VCKFSRIYFLIFFLSSLSFAEELRDPTMPIHFSGSVGTQPMVSLKLNSILISQQRRVAVINGQFVRQGEEIKGTGFRVTGIHTNSVSLRSNESTRVLSLIDTKVKK